MINFTNDLIGVIQIVTTNPANVNIVEVERIVENTVRVDEAVAVEGIPSGVTSSVRLDKSGVRIRGPGRLSAT